MNIQKSFAANMRRIRKKNGFTQEQLAEKCGLHRTYIGGIEQARVNVSLKNIGKIANALGVNPALLFASAASSGKKANDPANGTATKNADAENKDTASRAISSMETRTLPESHASQEKISYYYLALQEDDDFIIDPIEVNDPDFDLQILVGLIQDGYTGEDLSKRYVETKRELLDFFHKTHHNK